MSHDVGQVRGRGAAILARLPKRANGAEVGVYRGRLSAFLLAADPELHLTMVDTWCAFDAASRYGKSGDWLASLQGPQWRECFYQAMWQTDFAAARRTIVRLASTEAAQHAPDGSFDFVFLDADHTYEGVREDIQAWFPKVRIGGWIGGHDIDFPDQPGWGVRAAVTELSQAVQGRIETGDDYTWFIHKKHEIAFPLPSDSGRLQQRPSPTVKQVASFVHAFMTGSKVSLEIVSERTHQCGVCEFIRTDDQGDWCGICGCTVSSDAKRLRNLAAFEENLPAWGCKHPQRAQGKGWSR